MSSINNKNKNIISFALYRASGGVKAAIREKQMELLGKPQGYVDPEVAILKIAGALELNAIFLKEKYGEEVRESTESIIAIIAYLRDWAS